MSMPISTGSFSKALWPGVNAWYGEAYDEYPVEWDKLFDKETSKRNYEEDVLVTSFGYAVQKPEGTGITYDTQRQGFITRYTHIVYALGFIITREMFEDDLYDVAAKKRAKGLAFSMRQTKEIIGANVYNRAFNASYIGGDGVSMVNAAHPNVVGGTWSNTLSVPQDLSEAALEQAVVQIAAFQNDRGLIISAVADTLILPWNLEFEAHRILKSEKRAGSDTNDANALRDMGKFRKGVVLSHFLTDPDAWFIRTNVPDSVKYFERRGDEFSEDNDFDTENAKFKASGRYSFGWSDARGIFGSAGA
jgi:hypothetical protein